MRIILYCFLATSSLIGCSNVETVENKDDNGVLIERYSRKKDSFAKHGPYFSYHPNGQVMEQSTYKDDVLQGETKVFFENGKLDYVEHYKNGKYEGLYQKYFENGQLSNEGQYVDNAMSGIWKRWYKTGELREEVTFADNNENGPFKEFHKNGKPKTEGVYVNGDNEQGELKMFDENGDLIQKMYCEYGVCAASWKAGEGDIEVDTAKIKRLAELKRNAEMRGN
ncbi:MAG TPA: toxin-antitoxin system YwqK family antitoxin [Bacteroidetes bacterium]|nr:toxin-antitoxin system YwqK family antitoxin [Bacteroidota bacterium]